MARSSLANSSSKLNLYDRKTAWLQQTIQAGNRMADALRCASVPESVGGELLAADWNGLMAELVELML